MHLVKVMKSKKVHAFKTALIMEKISAKLKYLPQRKALSQQDYCNTKKTF